jgi:hypothetical protein
MIYIILSFFLYFSKLKKNKFFKNENKICTTFFQIALNDSDNI